MGMKIVVDKRTELMSIVLGLAQGNEYIEKHFSFNVKDDYRKKVYEHFSKYSNHKCIKFAKEIAEKEEGFNFDNPIRLAFSLDGDLSFDGLIESYLINELEDEMLIKEFVNSLVDFAKDSNFVDFYNEQQNYYLFKVEEINNLFNGKKFVSILEEFLKRNVNEDFSVNIIPMLVNANHGFSNRGINYANIGLLSEDFETIEPFNKGYNHIIIHEICHCFVNCNTKQIKLQLPEEFILKLKSVGYGNSISYLNDTIVRAMTIRLREKLENIDVQKFLNREKDWGFVLVADVYQELIKYENQNLSWEEYFTNFIKNVLNKPMIQK